MQGDYAFSALLSPVANVPCDAMATTFDHLPDDLLLRIASFLPVRAVAVLGACIPRVTALAPMYLCCACSSPLFLCSELCLPVTQGYLSPSIAALQATTRVMRCTRQCHRSEPRRRVCTECGAFVALILDGAVTPLVYHADVRRVPSDPKRHSIMRVAVNARLEKFTTWCNDSSTQNVLCACGNTVAKLAAFRQTLRWVGSSFVTKAIAFTAVHRGAVVERGAHASIIACLAGEMFKLTLLECVACAAHLGWRVIDMVVVDDADDNGDDDDDDRDNHHGGEGDKRLEQRDIDKWNKEDDEVVFEKVAKRYRREEASFYQTEKCPIAPELVGRFIIVEDALACRLRPQSRNGPENAVSHTLSEQV